MIRQARLADLDKIYLLYRSLSLDRSKLNDPGYLVYIQQQGFLLGLETKATFKKKILRAKEFLVAEKNRKIIGYIVADYREKNCEEDRRQSWFDRVWRRRYFRHPRSMVVDSCGVDGDYRGNGIGSGLLKRLEKNLKAQKFRYLFSSVALSPITNCATILFHAKNGFQRVATSRPGALYDLAYYVCLLMGKKI